MNPLLKRLASLRVKVRFLDGWQGVCALLSVILGAGMAVGMLDYWVHLPSLVRAIGLVSLLIGSGLTAYRYLFRPFARPCDDLSLALRVEEVYPELNDALASTVQFLKLTPEEQARVGGSASMRERTIQGAAEKASQCDFGRVLDRKGALLFGVGACAILLVAGLVVGLNRSYAGIAFLRLVEPFGQHTWTRVEVARHSPAELLDQMAEDKNWESLNDKHSRKEKDCIAIGRPYFIKVNLHGQIPAQARVEIDGLIRSDKMIPLQPGADKQTASFVTAIDMTQQYQKFKFRITANDGSFPERSGTWHEVEVLAPPQLIDLDGQPSPQIMLYPPRYTDLPAPTALAAGTRHLDLFAGTNVVLRARANRPLEQAWVEYRPENILVAPAALLTFMGQTDPLTAVAQAAGGHAVWGRFPAEFAKDQATFQVTFMPWVSGGYVLHLRDKDRLDRHEVSDLRVQRDPTPDVKVLRPGTSVTALPDADVGFTFRVTDEIFAVRSVFIEYRRKTQAPDGSWKLDSPKRNVLYDAAQYGQLLPKLMAHAGRSMWVGPDLRLRPKELQVETVWRLRNEFKEGDLVVVEIGADDFCDIYPGREPGRSQPIELRIVSRGQLVKDADDAMRDIQQKVVRLEKMQEQAMNTVKEIKKETKIDQKAKDAIAEAEQTQREIQDMIGKNPDQGLRGELKDLQKLLKDNKQTDTQAFQKSGMVKGVMDQIAAQELPQIEPKLAEARNELTQNSKNTPKTQKKLEETAQLQAKVLRGLNELNKELAPYQSLLEQRARVRDIIEKQQNLQKELETLNAEKTEYERNNPNDKQKPEWVKKNQEDINRKGQEQRELAQQTEKLLQDMKAARDLREKNGDKETAKKIDDAIKKAEAPNEPKASKRPMPEEKTPITSKMKDVAKELQNKTEAPQKALDQQKEIVKDLDQVLAALEGRNQDTTREEIQKRQQAEKNIDALAKELKQLQDQAKKLEKIDRAQQQKRQELDDKLANVKKELDKAEKFEDAKERLQNRKELEDKLAQIEKQIDKLQAEAKKADKLEQERQMKRKELDEKMALLQKEKEKAEKIDDMQERLKKKEELAKQEAQLQKEIAQMKAEAKKAEQNEQDRQQQQQQLTQQEKQTEKDIAKAGKMEDAKERQKNKQDLEQQQANLQKQQAQAQKDDDMEERLKQKKELIEKHDQLQEKIEKAARELARLQEQRAANDLNEAAKEVEKAKQKIQNGEDPQEPQKEARDKLKDAKNELAQSEEELSRELLIKIADKLKGLKERQDAVLQRSHDLHAKILKKKSWSDPFLDTMTGNVDAQRGIADETDSLKDKLKEAKVFHSILERAKESMDKADDVMKTRLEEGKDRRYAEKGEKMDDMELKDEVAWHTDTVKHQKQAAQRLDRLLDALKEELAKKPKKKQDNDMAQNDPMNEGKEPQGGMRAADGIPGTAQLKALRAEQLDLNERTEEFAQRHPDSNQLNNDQQRELRELEQEQQRLQELFQELVAPPQQKEGDPQ